MILPLMFCHQRASNSSFCQNLADTREEIIDSRSSSSKVRRVLHNCSSFLRAEHKLSHTGDWNYNPQMERSDTEDDPEENEINNEVQKLEEHSPKPLSQLDFYQANPFANCQTDRMSNINQDEIPKANDHYFNRYFNIHLTLHDMSNTCF